MPATTRTKRRKKRISHLSKPQEMGLTEWQVALRRQFGSEQSFILRNLGSDPVFSEFSVTNPRTKKSYRVAVRGSALGINYCNCPDFAVNTLGTCKHVEHVLSRLSRRHGAALRAGYQPPFSEVSIRYGECRQILLSFGSKADTRLRRKAAAFFDRHGLILPSAIESFDRFIHEVRRDGHDIRIYDDAMALIATLRDDRSREKELAHLYGPRKGDAPWKQLLKVGLLPYQKEGAYFAARAGRALIADDMGLGKTIQAIAAAEILGRHFGLERVLVICPSSLKSQWSSEIAKFSRRASAIVEGATHRRARIYQEDGAFFKIVNYDVVHRDLDAIAAWRPDLVILDEAQRIKNWQTRAARTVKQIESRFAFVLTGTPLENRLEELHSIVEFVDRFRLGPLFAFKAAHEVHEGGSAKVVGYKNLNAINGTLSSILIRRRKDEVLKQLPPRMDKNFFVPMTPQQWVPHDENKEIVARIVTKWHRFGFLTESDQLRLRIALQYMRMSCDNTYLVDHQSRHGVKVDELCKLLSEVFEDQEAKVVIFSQWLKMNELVAEMLDDRRWGYVHLHGGVPSRQRSELTRALREQPDCRVFLSSDAGGVGLNLQSASTVINMDLPWNPAVLEQRIGRVHRLGQGRPVRVVNFISEGTIEHGMLSLLSFKKSVFSGVIDGGSDEVFMGESALKRFMKTVEIASGSVPSVLPTPVDEELLGKREGDDSDDSVEPLTHAAAGEEASAHRDREMLGILLSSGARLLQTIGQRLIEPVSHLEAQPDALGPARLETDPLTGQRELRVTLPDEAVLKAWLLRLTDFMRATMPVR